MAKSKRETAELAELAALHATVGAALELFPEHLILLDSRLDRMTAAIETILDLFMHRHNVTHQALMAQRAKRDAAALAEAARVAALERVQRDLMDRNRHLAMIADRFETDHIDIHLILDSGRRVLVVDTLGPDYVVLREGAGAIICEGELRLSLPGPGGGAVVFQQTVHLPQGARLDNRQVYVKHGALPQPEPAAPIEADAVDLPIPGRPKPAV